MEGEKARESFTVLRLLAWERKFDGNVDLLACGIIGRRGKSGDAQDVHQSSIGMFNRILMLVDGG